MDIIDTRQSDEWSKYLEMYHWESVRLSNGSILRMVPLLGVKFAKLQRPKPLTKGDLEEIDRICKKNRTVFIRIFPNLKQDVSILEKHKYKVDNSTDSPPKTMLMDLQKDQQKLWNNLSKGCRYSINRANRYGVKVEIIQNPKTEDIENFHKLIAKRGKKKNYHVQSMQDQKHKVKVFGDQSYIANAYDKEGNILGTKMFLGLNNNIWYFSGGTSELGQKSKGGYKLLWDSIVYFKDKGYEVMDLEGLADDRLKDKTKSWRGYTEFKLKFNGEIIEYPLPYKKYFNFLSR